MLPLVLAFSYAIGFISWNIFLRQFGYFEYNLLQTRFISAGILFSIYLSFLLHLVDMIRKRFTKKRKKPFLQWIKEKKFLVCSIIIVFLFVFSFEVFPITAQYFGGAKPIPASLVADIDTLKLLADFGVQLVENGEGKESRQTRAL